MRFGWMLATFSATVALSACGGSSQSGSATGGKEGSGVKGGSGGNGGGASNASAGGASGSAPNASGSATNAPGGATNARVPATYVIRARGVVPPAITVPAFLAIQLTAVSGDGKPHRVTLQARSGVTLNVPAGGRASTLVPGLPSAQYKLQVDGVARGSLNTGGEPGP